MKFKGTLQGPWKAVLGFGVVIEPEHSTPSGHCLGSNKRKVEAKKNPGVDDAANVDIFKEHLTLMCGLYLLQQTKFLEKPGKWSIQFSLLQNESWGDPGHVSVLHF